MASKKDSGQNSESNSGWNADELANAWQKCLLKANVAAIEYVEPFRKLLQDRPAKELLPRIPEVWNKAIDAQYTDKDGVNNRAFVCAIAGGPSEHCTWPLYNAVGAVYPYLTREERDIALGELIGIFNGLNYADVQGYRGVGHTTGIREPPLLADITICNGLYWPGLEDGEYFLRKYKNDSDFSRFREENIDNNGMFDPMPIKSDFVMAYTLLRKDFCNFGEEYVLNANKTFLDRTVRAITWMRFANAKDDAQIKEGYERLKELLPESLHDKIEQYRIDGGWADRKKFNDY